MIKVRVIPQLLLASGLMMKPVRFVERPRNIGNPIAIARVFETRQVDELILLNIDRSISGGYVNPTVVANIAEQLTVPFSVGGGVRDMEAVSRLIGAGAEKIVLNTVAVQVPELISEAAERFGSQCVVVSIDAKRHPDGNYEAYIENGRTATAQAPDDLARSCKARGAGEILINSIDRDGTMDGFDLELIKRVSDAVDLPVIAAGGAGSESDCVRAVLEGGADAVSVGSLFHFRRVTPRMVKEAMAAQGIPVRMDG